MRGPPPRAYRREVTESRPSSARRRLWIVSAIVAALALVLLLTRHEPPSPAAPGTVPRVSEIAADSSRAMRLEVSPPSVARVWLARVTPAGPEASQPPLPEPAPLAPPPESGSPPSLVVDPGLKPPILRGAASLSAPPGAGEAWVDLDVRVDERGAVTDARRAAGSEDPRIVAAAVACARSMRFYPALRGGKPIAVWCRQRFDFGRAR